MQISAQPSPLSSEVIDDRVATVLEAGTNITLNYDDAANVLTISATPGGSGYTDEQAQDAIGTILQDSATIDYVYNDATPYITGLVKDNSITEAMLSLADNTTKNSSATAHGLLPKLSNDTTHFLRGDGTWVVPPTGTTYTDEQAQDAVGTILTDTSTIDFTYNDATPSIIADVKDASITEAKLLLADNTTQNVSITKHGLVPKAPNVATQYLDGTGVWSTPAGGASDWTRVDTSVSTLTSGLLAFWRMEETSGNRLDSVGSLALIPQGSATYALGKHGNSAKTNGVSGTYFSIADNATLSVGAAQDFTVACWAYFEDLPGAGMQCLIGKGNVTSNYDNAEYMLWRESGTIRFVVGSGSVRTTVNSGFSPSVNTWFLAVAWLDAANNLLWIQVNNGTPVSIACTNDSYDSTGAMEVGRQPGWSGSPIFNGRIDNVMFYKRILTTAERTALWNSGLGLDYSELGGGATFVHPTITADLVLAGSSTLTAGEPLESARGIKLGNTTGITNGVIRWTGTDLEVRKDNTWVSLTQANEASRFLLLGV